MGDHNQFSTTDTSAKMRAVVSVVKHKGFDTSSYNNDIALLKLRKPIAFSRSIRPICLPKENSEYAGYTFFYKLYSSKRVALKRLYRKLTSSTYI